MAREIYIRLMLLQKASDLGIHVGDDAVATTASEMLRQLSRNHQPVPPAEFVKQILVTAGHDRRGFSILRPGRPDH